MTEDEIKIQNMYNYISSVKSACDEFQSDFMDLFLEDDVTIDNVRVLFNRFRSETSCCDCKGS